MSPSVRRTLGILCLVAAIVLAVLNLKRVANLGMMALVPMFILIGAVLIRSSKRPRVD
jgi:hypothetical protein